MKHARLLSLALLAGIAVAFCAGGCTPAYSMPIREKCRLGAWLALNIAKVAPPLSVPSPDKPDQGDTCPDCGGTGKLPGDGVIHPTCSTCNGTGRKPAAAFDPPAEAEAFQAEELRLEAVNRAAKEAAAKAPPAKPAAPIVERYAVPPSDGRVYRKVCRNGSCSWEPVQ